MRAKVKGLVFLMMAAALSGCGSPNAHVRAVYMLIDTSGTYVKQVDKADHIVNYLLGTLNSGDSLAVASVTSRSFTQKDIIAKATFDRVPSQADAQRLAFRKKVDTFCARVERHPGTAYTDITGGIIQAAEWLNETGAGKKTVIIFSDMQQDLGKGTIRHFAIDMKGIRFVALNVIKLRTDNEDPRRYMDRLAHWKKRLITAGATSWKVVNDWQDHPEKILHMS